MGSRRRTAACALAVLILCTAVGIVAATSVRRGVAAPADHTLSWRSCNEGVQCASLAVPRSYDDPDGPTIALDVARVRAAEPGERAGSLVVNPGGPGVSAVDQLRGIAAALPPSLRDRFDIVTFDPRGVGGTTPVDCGAPLDPVFDATFSPTTPAQRDALVAALRSVANACAQRNGALLAEVSTDTAARDLDAVRAALGEPRLNYLGFSYGTYLGALYAAHFPERVRALVLDGAVDPGVDAAGSTLLQARGFEANLDAFLAWCSARRDCAFHHAGDAEGAYDRLRARVQATPIPASGRGGRALNDTRFDAAVLQLLYGGRGSWSTLAAGLAGADDDDGDLLLGVADRFLGRERDGGDDRTVDAFWAIGCLDGPSFDLAQSAAIEMQARRVAPRLGAFVANFSLACAVWPTSSATVPRPPSIDGVAPRALVIGATADPATPLASAKRLARALGTSSLVVADGDQHTTLGSGNDCVDDVVDGYLRTPAAPVGLRRC